MWSSVSNSVLQQKHKADAGYKSGRRCFIASKVGSSSKKSFVLIDFLYDETKEVPLEEEPYTCQVAFQETFRSTFNWFKILKRLSESRVWNCLAWKISLINFL